MESLISGGLEEPVTPVEKSVPTEPQIETPVQVETTQPQSVDTLIENVVEQEVVSNPEWMNNLSERFRTESTLSKYNDMDSFIEGHLSLNKKIGEKFEVPNGDDADAMNAWFNKLGRPENADGYTLDLGEDSPFSVDEIESTKSAMHELGISQKQFDGLMKVYSDDISKQGDMETQQAEERSRTQLNEAIVSLDNEWGDKRDVNTKIASKALQKFGIANKFVELNLGNDADVIRLGYQLAQLSGETMLETTESAPANFATAREQIVNSVEFTDKTHRNHKNAVKQYHDLYKNQYR